MDQRWMTRRGALAAGVGLLSALAGCDGDGDGGTDAPTATPSPTETTQAGTETQTPLPDVSVGTTQVASGFTSPVAVETPGDGRHYVVDQPGTVEVVEDGRVRDEPFLDVSDRIVPVSGYTEQGLLGLTFHPNYDENGRVFVRYSGPPVAGLPSNYSHTFVLAEFTADPDAAVADADSEARLLEIHQPQRNHNAGDLAFGPDGYLYVGVGDGGGANDEGTGHVEDWYGAVPGGNGQDVEENMLGSILRLDVDDGDGRGDYAIPADNPLVDAPGFDEQYAWGLRNPWRFSFGPDGRFFVADVGQNEYEEINVVERGGNYGWNVREGTHCFRADSCPAETPDGETLIDPVVEYPHGDAPVSGIAVIGGYLYDGSALSALQGRYVFADWQAGGRLFVADPANEGQWATGTATVAGDFGNMVLAFGVTPQGELLVCTTNEGEVTGDTGAVYRLTEV